MTKSDKAAEMFPIVEAVLSGELTRGEFCEMTGLKMSSFEYWKRKYTKRQSGGVLILEGISIESTRQRKRLQSGVKKENKT